MRNGSTDLKVTQDVKIKIKQSGSICIHMYICSYAVATAGAATAEHRILFIR